MGHRSALCSPDPDSKRETEEGECDLAAGYECADRGTAEGTQVERQGRQARSVRPRKRTVYRRHGHSEITFATLQHPGMICIATQHPLSTVGPFVTESAV